MSDNSKQSVVYELPGMEDLLIKKDIKYNEGEEESLHFDICYPSNSDQKYPVIIFVMGYSDETMNKMTGSRLKEINQYISWSKLMAASGVVAVTYETNQPERDIGELIKYLQINAESLNIYGNRIGIWACSGNVPTALSVMITKNEHLIQCAVFYYGFMLDWNDSMHVSEASKRIGFVYPNKISFDKISQNIPQLIIRSGSEENPHINDSIDFYVNYVISKNKPVTCINYPLGSHGFDVLLDNDFTIELIKQTIRFLQFHLNS